MGVLDNDYAVMIGAPSAFRDVAETKLQNLTLQQGADQQQIADLQKQLLSASGALTVDEEIIANLHLALDKQNGQISSLQSQLAAAAGPLGDILILRDLQKWNDPVTGWQPPQVSAAIGANPPAAYSRDWDASLNLVLSTTGKAGQYSDWLTALHIPNAVKPTTKAAMIGWGFTTDGNQKYVQCLERDALFAINGGLLNGSFQFNAVTGQAQIERGPDPVTGKGSWMDAGIPVPRFAAGHHTLEILYFFDQAAKTIQYAMIAVDGVRTLIPAATGIRKAFPPWTPGKLHLQAQEDANSQGGTFQTVFDSIWAVIL